MIRRSSLSDMVGPRRGGEKAEGCCIERAIESDYIHNQDD
jgi:hypothetical protein